MSAEKSFFIWTKKKATEKSEDGKRIKVNAKFDKEHEKDRQEVEVRKKTKNRGNARGPAHVTNVKKTDED